MKVSELVTGKPWKYTYGKPFELIGPCWKCDVPGIHHIFSLHYISQPWRMTRMCTYCEAVWVEDVEWLKEGA